MDIKFTPLYARVVLKRTVTEKLGSILLPESAKNRHTPDKGILLKIGHTASPELEQFIGKEVLYAKWAGAPLDLEDYKGKDLWICQDEDILGVADDVELTVSLEIGHD